MTSEKYVFNFIVDSKFNGKGFNDIDTALKKSEKESEKLNKSLNSLSKVTGINKLQSSFNVLNRRISKLNSTVKDVRTELRKMNDSLREVGQKSNVWDRQSTHVKTLKGNVDSLTNSVKEYNRNTQKMSSPKRVTPEGPIATHHYSHRERNMGRRNPTGEMIETYQPFLMQSPLTGLYGALGLNELKDFTFDLGVKEETNKILMENIGGDYGSFDQITNGQLISMQDLITAMNAQRAIAGLTPEQVNASAPTVAKFGTYAKILTGSDDKANEAMLRLAKGYNGQFAGVDQYGITKESLANTSVGYKKGDSYEKYLAAVDEIMGTQMDKLMGTTQGQISQMQKGFRRAGKEMTNMIMPFVKTFLQIFNQINDVTKGIPSKLIILSGAVLGLTAVLTNAANMIISSYMTMRDITQRGRAWVNGPQVTDQNPFDKDFLGKDEKNDYFNQQIASGALEQGKSVADLIAETKEHYAEQHPLKASFEDAMRSTAQSKKESIRAAPGKIKEQAKSRFKDPMATADRIRGYFEAGPAYDSEKSLRRRNVADLNNLADPTLSLQEKFERIFKRGTAEDVRAGGGADRFSYDDLSYTTYFKNLNTLWKDSITNSKSQISSFAKDTKEKLKGMSINDLVSSADNRASALKNKAIDKTVDFAIDSGAFDIVNNKMARYGKHIKSFQNQWELVIRRLRKRINFHFTNIQKEATKHFNRLSKEIDKSLEDLGPLWDNTVEDLKEQWTSFKTTASSTLSDLTTNLSSNLTELRSQFTETISGFDLSWSQIMNKIDQKVSQKLFSIQSKWDTTLDNLKNSISSAFTANIYDPIVTRFESVVSSVSDRVSSLKSTWDSSLTRITLSVENKIADIRSDINTSLENITSNISSKVSKIHNIWDNILIDIPIAVRTRLSPIKSIFKDTLEDVSIKVANSLGKIRKRWDSSLDDISSAVGDKVSSVQDTVDNNVNSINNRVNQGLNSIRNKWNNTLGSISKGISTRLDNIRSIWDNTLGGISDAIDDNISTVKNIWENSIIDLTGSWNQFKIKAKDAIDSLGPEIQTQVTSIKTEILESFPILTSDWSEMMDTLKERATSKFDELRTEWGGSLDEMSTTLQNKFTEVSEEVTPFFSQLNKNWQNSIRSLVKEWNKGINSMKNKLTETPLGDLYGKGKSKLGDVGGSFSDKINSQFGDNNYYQRMKEGLGKGKKGVSNYFNEEVGTDKDGNTITRKQAVGDTLRGLDHGKVMMGGGFALNQMGGMVGGRVGETMEKTGNYMTMAGTGIETAGQIKGFLDKNEQLKKVLFDSAKGFGSLLKKGVGGAMTVLQETFGLSFLGSVGVLAGGFVAILAVVKVIQHYWDNIVQTVSNFLNWVKGVAVTIFVEPLIPVFEAIDSVWNAIMGIFGTGGSGDILVDAGNTIIALLQPVGQLIMGVAKVLGFLIKIGLAPLTNVLRGLAMGIKGVVDLFRWAVGGIVKVFEPVITAIQKLFEFIAEKAGWLIDALGMGGNGEENPDYDGDGSPDKDTTATSWAKQLVDERDHPEKYQNKPSEDIDTASLGDLNIEGMNNGKEQSMDLSGSNLEMNTPEVKMQNEEVEQQQPQVEIPQQNIPTSAIQDPAAQNKINNLQKHMASVQNKALNGMEQKSQGKGSFRDDDAVDKAFDTGLDIAGTLVDAIPGGGVISQGIDAFNRKQEMTRHDAQKTDYLHSLGMKSQDEQDTFEDQLWDGSIGNLLGGADHSKYMRQEKREEEFLNKHGFQSQNQKDNIIDKMWDIGAGIYAGVTSLNPWEGIQAIDDSRRGRHNDREHEEYEKGINAYQQIANGQGPTPPPNPQNVPKPQISTPQTQDKDMKNRGTATPITNYLTVNVDNVSDESHIQKMVDAITKVLTFENIKAGRTIGNGDA